MVNKITLIFLLICIWTISAFAIEPLPIDQAFQFTATAKNYQMILLRWDIAPDNYLYQKDFHFEVVKPNGVTLGNPLFPSDTQPLKTTLGTFDVYSGSLVIPVPIINATEKNIVVQVRYQGCSKAGYCYPPTTKNVLIDLAGNYGVFTPGVTDTTISPPETTTSSPSAKITTLLTDHSDAMIILGFLGFGILLSFTPCVLPMIPILSSMIVGREKMTHWHSFLLSLFYVLGMAIMYAFAGILFGVLGNNIQVFFQKPWIIFCFSLLFVAMALSLFGLYTIQLPEKFRSKIASTSHHQKSGTYFGAAVMGVLSTLILSPCVTPPLVAVLGFVSQTGNALLGGSALFAMGMGMGMPLLLIGAIGPRVLPKSGVWMNTLKNMMGIMMLAVAIFMLERILPGLLTMLLWAGLCFGTALYLGALSTAETRWMLIKKSIGLLFFVYGVLLIVGAYHGNTNPLGVLKAPAEQCQADSLRFQPVHSVSDIQAALQSAGDKPVLLDFSADWCIACKELNAETFENHAVKAELAHFVLLRVDVTKNSMENQLVEKHYGVVAPPTLLFFKNGVEMPNSRIVGYLASNDFLRHLNQTVSIVH